MGQFYEEIPEHLFSWIQQQKMFWVATAPLSPNGHVNLSPKGFEGTFHIVDKNKVWYEDLSGSGIETISHLRENGRLTIMFCAFEGGPRIVRLFGTGTVHEFDTLEYNALIPLEKRQPGSRAVIILDIHKVGSSCGFAIPFYEFKSHRMTLHKMAIKKEGEDIKVESCTPSNGSSSLKTYASAISDREANATKELTYPQRGLKFYWKNNNANSIDGLPGLQSAHTSTKLFNEHDVGMLRGNTVRQLSVSAITKYVDGNLVIGFISGMIISGLCAILLGGYGGKFWWQKQLV